ncbi:glycosyl hydrolase [Niveibacterium sp. SC-1]|uniref:glycosyl hydrolase n=1 Tax=Niveibacterium sp. SC-1 TaxID=3135646 RepID=UPI00311F3EB1
MTTHRPLVLACLLLTLTACGGGGGDSGGGGSKAPSESEVIGAAPAVPAAARFAPPSGQTMLLVGQAVDEISAYTDSVGAPAGFMLYTDLAGQAGLAWGTHGGGCNDAGTHDMPASRAKLPRGVIQIGLWLGGGQLEQAGNGALDAKIVQLGEMLRATGAPVMLRIGYEFEGTWNAYEPSAYQRAFRRMVSILRGNKVGDTEMSAVPNIAFVWHGAANSGTYGNRSFDAWYPGDAYVDWVGVSWFGETTGAAENWDADARNRMAAFARAHGKPLMIAESTPRAAYPNSADATWGRWYQPVLDWIAANDVRAWSYINQDWNAQPMWSAACGQGQWGNSRIQDSSSGIRTNWDAEMAGSRWIKDSSDLWQKIGFGL